MRFQIPELCRFALALLLVTSTIGTQAATAAEVPHWVWAGKPAANQTVRVRKTFTVTGGVKSAILVATADNKIKAWVNGEELLSGNNWAELNRADVTKAIKAGTNVLAVEGTNVDGIAGLIAALRVTTDDGKTLEIVTDAGWKGTAESAQKWRDSNFDDAAWAHVNVLGAAGQKGLPWSKDVTADVVESTLQAEPGTTFLPVVAENVTPRKDFVVETVYDVPKAFGSWVALTTDPQGNLIASAQGGEGLFRIKPGVDGKETQVEKIPVDLSGAQGLCWAFDSLYVVINGGPKPGLHRAKDTDGDGELDSVEFLIPIAGIGEHGPHAIILSPDKKSLYLAAGNHTKLPEQVTGSLIPQNWNEDHLLPRHWDANGHAVGILAPGGWILKLDPDAKQREVVSIGYRNQYDIAFNADGELFTYDADMEWDLGSPWYRATRVNHATSGSEFGWRSGTGKWPAYYEDSLPEVVDIGPGSPVGIVFGEGAKFPAKYQRALFLLDWTYSTIYAVHLMPDGSTYRGEKEDFLNGQPMQVTDAAIGADGSMYFAAGGRGTKSTLYRVRYTGAESTAPVDLKNKENVAQRELRHKLEALHGKTGGGDLDFIISQLGSDDRFIRYAARIALEWQPVESWKGRILSGKDLSPRASINGLIALSRQGNPEDLSGVLEALCRLDFNKLDRQEKLALLRTYQLAFIRLGAPDEAWRQKAIAILNPLYPAKEYSLNAELVQLLVFLNAPEVVSKTLKLMKELGPEPLPDWGYLVNRSERYGSTVARILENHPPARAIHLAFVLRNQKDGWTLPERREYFQFYIDASKYSAGNSYGKFLQNFREDALLTCSPSELVALSDISSQSLLAELPKVDPPVGPGRKWTRDEVLTHVGTGLKGRSFAKGRNLFFATACAKCHRLNAEGGAIGPDLSTAGKKFPLPDLIDSVIEPSKVISDQYASHQVATTDGQTLVGRAVQIGDAMHVYTTDADAPPKIIKMTDIDEIAPSKISQMPAGLFDTLNPEELKDLMAYIMSGADPKAAVYKK